MNLQPHVRLGEVADLNPALDVDLRPEASVAFVPMASVVAECASVTETERRPYATVARGYTPFRRDDVLVAKITPCFENGKIAQAKLQCEVGFGSTEFHVVRAREERADARYLVHFLRQKSIRREGERRMTGSAGQRRVPEHFLAQLKIPLPALPEQRRIAEVLDRAEALRAKRRAALAHLDTLAQSIFLEMFGDPATNPHGWPIRIIRNMLTEAAYGTSEKSSADGDFPVLRMNNLTRTGQLDLTDLKFMNLPECQHARYLVRRGDVLFNRTNSADLVGKTAIVRHERPMAYAGYLIRLRTTNDNDPEYLAAFLNTGYAKRVLRGMCKSIIGMANINATELQAIRIAQPPLSLQQDFARRIAAVERLKSSHRDSLAQLDALFASLQHRAFRGEL